MKKLNVSATPGKDAKGTVGEFVNQMKKFNVSDKDIQMMLKSGKSGQVDYVMEQYGMSASDVVDALKRGEPLIEGLAQGGRIGLNTGSGLPIDPMDPDNKLNEVLNAFKKLSLGAQNRIGFKKFFEIYARENFASGGRIGFKKGMDRRTFMKIMGCLATLPIFGKFFKGAKTVKAVDKAKDVTNIVSQPPSYFFTLADKIKKLGKESKVKPQERVNEYSYVGKNGDEYTLTEDIGTGDMQIVKDKIGIGTYNDKSFDTINDRTVMEYKKGRGDETTKGTPPDEYDEYKVEFDQDGTMAGADNISEITKKEIVDEVSDNIPSIKKASGGIARMLGE